MYLVGSNLFGSPLENPNIAIAIIARNAKPNRTAKRRSFKPLISIRLIYFKSTISYHKVYIVKFIGNKMKEKKIKELYSKVHAAGSIKFIIDDEDESDEDEDEEDEVTMMPMADMLNHKTGFNNVCH